MLHFIVLIIKQFQKHDISDDNFEIRFLKTFLYPLDSDDLICIL